MNNNQNIELPSREYLESKLMKRKASKRSPRRQLRVLTDKLTREHVRLLYKNQFDLIRQNKINEEEWNKLGSR